MPPQRVDIAAIAVGFEALTLREVLEQVGVPDVRLAPIGRGSALVPPRPSARPSSLDLAGAFACSEVVRTAYCIRPTNGVRSLAT